MPARTVAALSACAVAIVAAGASAQGTPPKTTVTGELGFVSATGNTSVNTLNVGEKISRTSGRWKLSQVAAYVYGKTDTVESANQLRAAVRADYAWRPRVGGFASGTYERNTFAGFNRRTDESIGVFWTALAAPADSINLDAGGVLTQQDNVDGTSKNFPAGRVAAAYKHAFSAASYFQQLAEYIPDLQSGGEYRANTESSLVAPISTRVGIKLGFALRFNSQPPTGFGTTDRLLTTSVQVTW